MGHNAHAEVENDVDYIDEQNNTSKKPKKDKKDKKHKKHKKKKDKKEKKEGKHRSDSVEWDLVLPFSSSESALRLPYE